MPLAGHDMLTTSTPHLFRSISTPMPLAGHDQTYSISGPFDSISTPMPLAGHDRHYFIERADVADFYSHAPRGA